jgi:hypothetical protein
MRSNSYHSKVPSPLCHTDGLMFCTTVGVCGIGLGNSEQMNPADSDRWYFLQSNISIFISLRQSLLLEIEILQAVN